VAAARAAAGRAASVDSAADSAVDRRQAQDASCDFQGRCSHLLTL
jgi:hypothetical protein